MFFCISHVVSNTLQRVKSRPLNLGAATTKKKVILCDRSIGVLGAAAAFADHGFKSHGFALRLHQSRCVALEKLLKCDRAVLRFPVCRYRVQLHTPVKCCSTLSKSTPNSQKLPRRFSSCSSCSVHPLCDRDVCGVIISTFFHCPLHRHSGLTRYKCC